MTTRNKRKLAALNKENWEEHPRGNLAQNSSAPRLQEDFITQFSEEIEGRVAKRLSKEFSRTENRILGALARLDGFLMNPLLPGGSRTTPEPTRNASGINQGTNEDDSQNDPHPEASLFHGQREENSGTERDYDRQASISWFKAFRKLFFDVEKIMHFLSRSEQSKCLFLKILYWSGSYFVKKFYFPRNWHKSFFLKKSKKSEFFESTEKQELFFGTNYFFEIWTVLLFFKICFSLLWRSWTLEKHFTGTSRWVVSIVIECHKVQIVVFYIEIQTKLQAKSSFTTDSFPIVEDSKLIILIFFPSKVFIVGPQWQRGHLVMIRFIVQTNFFSWNHWRPTCNQGGNRHFFTNKNITDYEISPWFFALTLF